MHLQGVKCWIIKNELFKFDVSCKYMNLITNSSLAEIAQLGDQNSTYWNPQTGTRHLTPFIPKLTVNAWYLFRYRIFFNKGIDEFPVTQYIEHLIKLAQIGILRQELVIFSPLSSLIKSVLYITYIISLVS